jgi:hypothetical protein
MMAWAERLVADGRPDVFGIGGNGHKVTISRAGVKPISQNGRHGGSRRVAPRIARRQPVAPPGIVGRAGRGRGVLPPEAWQVFFLTFGRRKIKQTSVSKTEWPLSFLQSTIYRAIRHVSHARKGRGHGGFAPLISGFPKWRRTTEGAPSAIGATGA